MAVDRLHAVRYCRFVARGVFAGSFDPPTIGHLDIIEAALSILDSLYVVVAANPEKRCMFSIEERLAMLERMNHFGERIQVRAWSGLIADFASINGCNVLVRGIRNPSELPYESTMASMNRRLAPAVRTVFFLCEPIHMDISSTLVRDILAHGRLPEGLVAPE
ncbi:MAG: pantetheine-phosphate adenylyltransferase, partial [Rectinema sp.]|nr:pantetheine-phosphate adenylyltransferase [Rectinema sp.]